MTFSWRNSKIKAKAKKYERLVHDADNPDFKSQHPELSKELMNKSIINKVETKKYLDKIMDKKFKYAERPKPSVIIKRYNRV